MAQNPRILVVGSVNMDLCVRVGQRPRPGQTVTGTDFRANPGGKGANQAVAAARLAAGCRMIGRVGDDEFGKTLRANLQAEGVDCKHVLVTNSTPSGMAFIVVDQDGENSIVVTGGANDRLSPDDVFAAETAFEDVAVVLLQLELPLPTVRAAADVARRHGCRVMLDPAPAMRDLPEALYQVDVLSPNASETELLTGAKTGEERVDKVAASALLQRGAKVAVLKLGARGSLVITADEHFYRVPPYKVAVRDTTGAGDAFTAALAVAMARDEPLRDAARFANAAGALACTRLGAQQAMPYATEVQMLMDSQQG